MVSDPTDRTKLWIQLDCRKPENIPLTSLEDLAKFQVVISCDWSTCIPSNFINFETAKESSRKRLWKWEEEAERKTVRKNDQAWRLNA